MRCFLVANGSCQSDINKRFSHVCFSRCLYILFLILISLYKSTIPATQQKKKHTGSKPIYRGSIFPSLGMAPKHLSRVLKCFLLCTSERCFFFFKFIYFWDRERQSMNGGGGRERGRHRIGSRLQALSHQPRARHGAWTHGPRDHDLSWSRTLNRLSHPGAPEVLFLNNIKRLNLISLSTYALCVVGFFLT